jgi:hypothetical protein
MASSFPVTIASDQSGLTVNAVADVVASGTITTQNLVPAGAATAGSAVSIALNSAGMITVQVTGVYTGALSLQATVNGTNWITVGGTPFMGIAGGTSTATIASATQSIFQAQVAGYNQARITGLAAMTGTATVTIRESIGNAPATVALPAGAASIGTVVIGSGTVTTVSTVTAVTTVATVSSVTAANLNIPGAIVDVASAALTTTTTTATLTPTFGTSYIVNIPVTVVSGTTPTLDVEIQESDDTGTNWYSVYDFPRITAVGMYRSPKLRLNGNRVRYVQTVAGTTPSFTRAINRLQASDTGQIVRTLVDRSVVLTTLSSTTPVLNTEGCTSAVISVNIGATTIAPVLQLQGSDDNLTWYSIGTTLTSVASSTVAGTVNTCLAKFMRIIVTTAGTGTTAGYVRLQAQGT